MDHQEKVWPKYVLRDSNNSIEGFELQILYGPSQLVEGYFS